MKQSHLENPSPTPSKKGLLTAAQTDWLFRNASFLIASIAVICIIGIGILLYLAARPNISHSGASFFTSSAWDPVPPDEDKKLGDLFGALPFIYGTLVTSFVALLIAVPIGVGAAIFLSEIAPRKISAPISFVIELLAAVPSIVYGFWALNYLVPFIQNRVQGWVSANFGQIPFFAPSPDAGVGQSYLAAGVILAMMVLPFITAVSRDVLRTVPMAQREAAYGMGATRWEAIRGVVLRYASSGIIGAIMLGLGRAIGETMAVTMVIGSRVSIPQFSDAASFSLFRPGYTMTALLADQYPSPNSPLHTAALTQVGLTLFLVTIVVNGMARGLVWLTAAKSSANDASMKAKAIIGSAGRIAAIGLFVLAFLYQIFRDLQSKGAAGLFGGAEIVAALLIGLALFNRQAPKTRLFLAWRKLNNRLAQGIALLCTLVACVSLLLLLALVAKDGISALNGQFFRPPALDDTGGALHAIVGTALLSLCASLIGIPIGIIGGIYLAEFGNTKRGGFIRFAVDLLNGVPSIVIGIFAFTLLIVPTQGKAGIAFSGAFALGIMMIPTIMRTTEELVRLVPISLREASLALGATYTRTLWQIVLPSARGGIVTGALLAVSRIAGETAPLLMVGCNSSLWNLDLKKPVASLPMQIYVLRDQPGSVAFHQLWGIAFLLVVMVLVFSLLARYFTRDKFRRAA